MTEASADVLKKENQKYFQNFYEKGALAGFYLDYLIASESNGEKGIFDLITFLIDQYGIEKPFPEKDLFQVISKEFPETKTCFDQMVNGKNPIPLNDVLENLGVEFVKSVEPTENTFYETGISRYSYRNNCKCIIVKNQPFNKEIGKRMIKIYSINNEPVQINRMTLLMPPKSAEAIVLGIDKDNTEMISLYPKAVSRNYFAMGVSLPDENKKSQLLKKVLEF